MPGGWKGAVFEDEALPFSIKAADPVPVTSVGWLYFKRVNGVGELFSMDENGNTEQFTVEGNLVAGAVTRHVYQKAVDATLSEPEARFGLIEVTVTGKTITLPAPAPSLNGCDVLIGPIGAFSTTVAILGGSSFGGGGMTSTVIPKGTTGHFVCDGTTWYMSGGGGVETLAITDLTDVSAKTGVGTTVVFNDTPTLLTPTIASFVNATHDHLSAAGGGTLSLPASVITSGTFAAARMQEVIALADLTDVTAKSGSGTTVIMGTSPTITTSLIWGNGQAFVDESANHTALRNGTNAQVLRVYKSFTDANNFRAIDIDTTNATIQIRSRRMTAGIEVAEGLDIITGVTSALNLSQASGATVGFFANVAENNIIPGPTNAVSLGHPTGTFKSLYLGTAVRITGQSGDIASPTDGDLWHDTTLKRLRMETNGIISSVAGETTIDASRKTGANWGAKVQAAIDEAATAGGGVVDARALTGAQVMTATVTWPTLGKAVQLLVGFCTVTAAAGLALMFDFPQSGSYGCQGSGIYGAGPYNTTLVPATGKTGIQVQDWAITLQDFDVTFAAGNNANLGVVYHCGPLGSPVTGGERSEIMRNVYILSQNNTGICLQLDNCQVSSFYDVFLGNCAYGLYLNEFACNATHFYNLQIENAVNSIVASRHDDVFFHGGTLQANPHSSPNLVWLTGNGPGGTGRFWFDHMHFEQQFSGEGAFCVQIENGPLFAYFDTCFFNGQDAGADLRNSGNSCVVTLDNCSPTKGVTNVGTARLKQVGPDIKGSPNDTGTGRTYWGDSSITCGYGAGDGLDLDFSIFNWKTVFFGHFGGPAYDADYLVSITPNAGSGKGGLFVRNGAHGVKIQTQTQSGMYFEAVDNVDNVIFYINATNGRTFISQSAIDGAGVGAPPAGPLYVANAAHTNIPTGTGEIAVVSIDLGNPMEWAAENRNYQSYVYISQPTIKFKTSDAHILEHASTFTIQGAPLAGTHCILDKTAYTLWVVTGMTELDGGLTVTGATTLNGATSVLSNDSVPFVASDTSSNSYFYYSRTFAQFGITQNALTSGNPVAFALYTAAHTGMTTAIEHQSILFDLSATKTWASGNVSTQREFYIGAPTYAFSGASTITDAATVYISGAPIAGTNCTISSPMALWIDDGAVRLDGQLGIGTFPSYWIHVKATNPIVYIESTSTTSYAEFIAVNNGGVYLASYLYDGSAASSSYGYTRADLGIVEYSGTKALVVATAGNAPLVFAANGTVRMTITGAGDVTLAMGTGSGSAIAVGKADVNTTAVGNVGTGEDTLISYSLPANSMVVNKSGVRVTAWGTLANNANSKTIKPYFGASLATVTAPASVSTTWYCEFVVYRTGLSAQTYSGTFYTQAAAGVAFVFPFSGTLTQTETSGITIKFTGEATSNDDIIQSGQVVEFFN